MKKININIWLIIINGLSILVPLIIIGQTVLAVRSNPQIHLYMDWAGHLSRAKKLDFPWNYGWDTGGFGGHTTLTYPPMAHVMLRVIGEITHNDYLTVAITVIGTIMLFIGVINWIFNKVLPHRTIARMCFSTISMGVMYFLAGDQLGSFEGLLITGGFPGTLGLILVILLVTTTSGYGQAVLLGLTLLTHTLSGLLAVLIILSQTILRRKVSKESFIPLLGGLIIGSPWWLAFLDSSFKGLAINMHGNWGIIPIIILILLLVMVLENRMVLTGKWLAVLIAGVLSITPIPVSYWLQSKLGISGIHFYRYQIYFYLLLMIFLAELLNRFKKKDLHIITACLLIAVAIVVVTQKVVVPATAKLSLNQSMVAEYNGRVMDASSIGNTQIYPRALEYLISQNSNLNGGIDMFYEASSLGIPFYSLAYNINENFFANGTYTFFLKEKDGKRKYYDIAKTAKLLGVNYISYMGELNPELTKYPTATMGGIIISPKDKEVITVPWHLLKVSDSKLIEPMTALPRVKRGLDLGKWWLDEIDYEKIYAKNNYQLGENLNFNKPIVSDVAIKPNLIKFTIDSEKITPVLVKFSYNRYWRVVKNKDNKQPVKPIWVTPGFIMVYGKGEVELKWTPPVYYTAAWMLSIFCIGYGLVRAKKSPTE